MDVRYTNKERKLLKYIAEVMGIKKGIDLSKIKFYKVRPRRNQ